MAYSSITKPSLHFNTKLTTGTGSSQAVTGLGFQPDWIWGKRRDSSGHHSLFDSVRGITKGIEANQSGAEFTSTDYYSSFDSDGFTIAAGSSGAGNGSSQTAAQWCWKANGSGSSNTDGSINTTATSVNTTAGFSISTYTGTGSDTTVGHGLGVTPKIVFFKRLDSSANWVVQTPLLGNKVQLVLNDTSAENTDSRLGASDNWSSSVFTVGTYGDMNASGGTYVAYAFAEKTGYSKFGSYTGNGSTDGTFVYTGFKPAFVMGKRTNSTEDWFLFDSARDTHNVNYKLLYPNGNNAEYTGVSARNDFLSNGFKMRITDAKENGSGSTYIYMAFAEEPLVANVGQGIPATAR